MVNHYVDDRSLRFRTATTITVILVILTSRVAFPTTTVRSRLKLTRAAIERPEWGRNRGCFSLNLTISPPQVKIAYLKWSGRPPGGTPLRPRLITAPGGHPQLF